MRTSALLLSCLLAVAEAGNLFNCTRPNANSCMGGDMILRCDGSGVGRVGRCSNNLAGYAPIGGPASCWQSSADAGDAACVKNCIVYADRPFSLPGCSPTFTEAAPTTTQPPRPSLPYSNSTMTTIVTVPATTSHPGAQPSVPAPIPVVPSSSRCVGFKCGNGPFYPQTNRTVVPLPGTAVGTGTGYTVLPAAPTSNHGSSNAKDDDHKFNVPVGPTTTAPNAFPTSGAVANKAHFVMAAAGLALACAL